MSHTPTHTLTPNGVKKSSLGFYLISLGCNPNYFPLPKQFPVELLSFTAALALTLEVFIENPQRARYVSLKSLCM